MVFFKTDTKLSKYFLFKIKGHNDITFDLFLDLIDEFVGFMSQTKCSFYKARLAVLSKYNPISSAVFISYRYNVPKTKRRGKNKRVVLFWAQLSFWLLSSAPWRFWPD